MNAGAFVERAGPNTSMTSDMTGAVKGSPGFLNGSDPCKDFGPFGAFHEMVSRVVLAPRKRKRADRVCQNNQIR